MDGYKVRFEHGRGHRMVLTGEPPIQSGEIDAIQYRMLSNCDISGVLPLETEEMDGVVALRYSLSGRRMLSQALRAARWTMEDAMTALCRLAEVLEMSREYMLDAERYILDDDFIFVGEGWHDLAFTYVPLWRQTASASIASGVEKLIVRWMMNVETPDGTAMQQLLRMAASPDFSPAQLRRYARQYLAGPIGSGELKSSGSRTYGTDRMPAVLDRSNAILPARGITEGRLRRQDAAGDLAPNGWPRQDSVSRQPSPESAAEPESLWGSGAGRGFADARSLAKASWPLGNDRQERERDGASQGLSGWLGEEPTWSGEEERPEAPASTDASSRRRIWLLAGAAAVTAAVWRFAYLPHPGTRGLMASLGLTLLAAGACFFLWDGKKPRREHGARRPKAGSSLGDGEAPPRPHPIPEFDEVGQMQMEVAPALSLELASTEPRPRRFGIAREPPSDDLRLGDYERRERRVEEPEAGTSWLGSQADGTRLLSDADKALAPSFQCYLEWESDEGRRRIPLAGDSFVIGRSKEAAHHVDETEGVSRAHLELIRAAGTWQARDLGSRNGSWLNGVPMAPYELYPLNKGDSIQIASSLYRFGEGM